MLVGFGYSVRRHHYTHRTPLACPNNPDSRAVLGDQKGGTSASVHATGGTRGHLTRGGSVARTGQPYLCTERTSANLRRKHRPRGAIWCRLRAAIRHTHESTTGTPQLPPAPGIHAGPFLPRATLPLSVSAHLANSALSPGEGFPRGVGDQSRVLYARLAQGNPLNPWAAGASAGAVACAGPAAQCKTAHAPALFLRETRSASRDRESDSVDRLVPPLRGAASTPLALC